MVNNKISRNCVLDYIYRKKPLENCFNKNIAEFRIELGKLLSTQIPSNILSTVDFVAPCPQTGIFYAVGLSLAIHKPYIPAVINQSLNSRYLDVVNADERKKFIWAKLMPIKSLVENKNILIVDEAIFTGMTLKILCQMLREAGANKIYLCIPSPMCWKKCMYEYLPQKNILLENIPPRMLSEYFNADGIFFQDYENFSNLVDKYFDVPCKDCFNY